MKRSANITRIALFTITGLMAASTPAFANHDDYYGNAPPRYGQRYDEGDFGRVRSDRRERFGRGYRCNKGSTGMILGAVAGGLLGRAVVGRYGDRTAGTIIGAGAGALGGRAIQRSDGRGC